MPWARVTPSAAKSADFRAGRSSSRACATRRRPRPAGRSGQSASTPLGYSNVCSGVECTWISPGWSDSTMNSTGSPTGTSTRSPFGVTVSLTIVGSICWTSGVVSVGSPLASLDAGSVGVASDEFASVDVGSVEGRRRRSRRSRSRGRWCRTGRPGSPRCGACVDPSTRGHTGQVCPQGAHLCQNPMWKQALDPSPRGRRHEREQMSERLRPRDLGLPGPGVCLDADAQRDGRDLRARRRVRLRPPERPRPDLVRAAPRQRSRRSLAGWRTRSGSTTRTRPRIPRTPPGPCRVRAASTSFGSWWAGSSPARWTVPCPLREMYFVEGLAGGRSRCSRSRTTCSWTGSTPSTSGRSCSTSTRSGRCSAVTSIPRIRRRRPPPAFQAVRDSVSDTGTVIDTVLSRSGAVLRAEATATSAGRVERPDRSTPRAPVNAQRHALPAAPVCRGAHRPRGLPQGASRPRR